MHYAIKYTYGRACNENGSRCGLYFAFPTKKGRDRWVDDGPDYVTDSGAREAIPASDPDLRSIFRRGYEVQNDGSIICY